MLSLYLKPIFLCMALSDILKHIATRIHCTVSYGKSGDNKILHFAYLPMSSFSWLWRIIVQDIVFLINNIFFSIFCALWFWCECWTAEYNLCCGSQSHSFVSSSKCSSHVNHLPREQKWEQRDCCTSSVIRDVNVGTWDCFWRNS